MQQRTTSYLYPTKTGYKLVTRTIGKRSKRTPRKRQMGVVERFFAPWLLVFTMSICYGMMLGKDMQVEQAQAQVDYFENVGGEVSTVAGQNLPEPTPEIEWKTGHATAYSCGGLVTEEEIRMNCPSLFSGSPKTANGTTPVVGKTMACDRANMGRTFFIDGIGERTCTDTGGAITGAGRFDIYLETVQEARKFGRQTDIKYYEVK